MRPPWSGPPEAVLGAAVPLHRVLARTDAVVVALTGMVAYPSGCTFDLDLAARRTRHDAAGWEAWAEAFFEEHLWAQRSHTPEALPEALLRCGVQFADGRKVANVELQAGWEPVGEPESPVLFETGNGPS